jgi:hypothetical protein
LENNLISSILPQRQELYEFLAQQSTAFANNPAAVLSDAARLLQEIQKLGATMNTRFDRLDRRVDAIEQRVGQIELRMRADYVSSICFPLLHLD